MASDGRVIIDVSLGTDDIKKDVKEVSGELGGLKGVLQKLGMTISQSMSKPVTGTVKQIHKDIDACAKAIERYQAQIQKAQVNKLPLEGQAANMGAELDAAKAKLAELQAQQAAAQNALQTPTDRPMTGGEIEAYIEAQNRLPQINAELEQQQAKVDSLENKWNGVCDKIDKYNLEISQAKQLIAANEKTAAELADELKEAESASRGLMKNSKTTSGEMKKMGKTARSFGSRLKSIVLGAFVFNGISAGLREMTSYFSTVLKTNTAFTAELARLKGALLTAFQPIYSVVVPALTWLIRALTSAVMAVAQFIAVISGTSLKANAAAAKGLYDQANALDSVGGAAKKASKSMAGFDEINVLQDNSASGGSGGSGGTTTDAPDFSLEGWDESKGNGILQTIMAIGAALTGLKLGSFIADLLTAGVKTETLAESIGLLGQKASLIGGVTLALTGGTVEAMGIVDTIREGLNGINFAKIIGGGGGLVGGAALIGTFFGVTMWGGAIGAIIAGVPAFFTGIYDACVNGLNWLNGLLIPLAATVGATGIGTIVGLLVGSLTGPQGALIGALIGLAVGLVTDLIILIVQKWDEIAAFFAPAVEWFDTNVIQPIGSFFSDLWSGISSTASICWQAIVDFFTPAINWFSELFGSVYQTISDIFYNIGVIASGCWEVIKVVWDVVADWFDTNVIQPVSKFFTDLWDGFLSKAKSAWESVKSVFSTVTSFFGDIFSAAWERVVAVFSPLGEVFVEIKDAVLSGFKTVVNGLITGINSAIAIPFNGINSALTTLRGISIVGITPFSALKTISVPQIPYLAQGAVLPANKPFMAVVGDQRHGTNVEAPLTTIQEAVALVLADQMGGMMAGFNAVTERQEQIIRAILSLDISDGALAAAVRRHQEKMAVVTGG